MTRYRWIFAVCSGSVSVVELPCFGERTEQIDLPLQNALVVVLFEHFLEGSGGRRVAKTGLPNQAP